MLFIASARRYSRFAPLGEDLINGKLLSFGRGRDRSRYLPQSANPPPRPLAAIRLGRSGNLIEVSEKLKAVKL